MPRKISSERLQSTFTKWIELFDELQSQRANAFAAPFFSIGPCSRTSNRILLYVGKATNGDWGLNDFLKKKNSAIDQRVRERIECTEQFLKSEVGGYSFPFWKLARRLRPGLADFVWTNLCKIGTRKGNPGNELIRAQEALAVETLSAEIEVHRPAIVYFVTNTFAERIIDRVVPSQAWQKDEDVWWIKGADSAPGFLWTKHPQGKLGRELDKWKSRFDELDH